MDKPTLWQTTDEVVILPGAMVCGDVTMGAGGSVWYNAVIRGDQAPIRIGENVNVQDGAVLHTGSKPLIIGNGVSIGHKAILHSCTVGENTLIGMGAIVIDGAVVGRDCIVGAGALVTGTARIPDGYMALGSPARPVRPLTPEEIERNRHRTAAYLEKKELYRG